MIDTRRRLLFNTLCHCATKQRSVKLPDILTVIGSTRAKAAGRVVVVVVMVMVGWGGGDAVKAHDKAVTLSGGSDAY